MMPISSRLPPLAALRTFEAVARLGSLSQAALELSVTKSAVSHQLRALEADLGAVLIRRGGTIRRAETTEAGAELLASVQQALTLLGSACHKVRTVNKSDRQVLSVSVNPALASLWLAPRIGRFIELHPDIDVQVHLHSHQEPAWKSESIDLAFLHVRKAGQHSAQPGDIDLMTETVVPICSPTLVAEAHRNDPLVLLKHRWLNEKHVDSPETDWRTWRRHLGLEDKPAREILTLSGISTVVAAAVAGVGIGLGRSPLIDQELANARLVALVPEKRMAGSWGYVMRPRPHRAMGAALPALVEFLADEGRSV